MRSVPDLFTTQPRNEILRLYSQYLGRLRTNRRDLRVVQSCRRIRVFARRAGNPDWAYFTYSFEISSLCRLKHFSAAWRQLRRWERAAWGRNLDPRALCWSRRELDWFFHYHPHVLYFLGRYQPALRMFEALLDQLVGRRREGMSYQVLWHVYRPVDRPRLPHEVTLYHLYRKLGKSLLEWSQWNRFVKGFHPRLLELAGITREELSQDPSRLRQLSEAIMAERTRRVTTGISFGERDLVDPPDKVRRSQKMLARKIAKFDAKTAKRKREERLENLFPELRVLSR